MSTRSIILEKATDTKDRNALAKMKKGDLATEAEKRMANTPWIPEILYLNPPTWKAVQQQKVAPLDN